MPEKLDRCVQELMRKGYTESQAWAICKARLGNHEHKTENEGYKCIKKRVNGIRFMSAQNAIAE